VRTVFFGTPEIAVPAVRALARTTDLVGVVCQPDRPAGRGLELTEPAVKRAARELGIDVHQPVKVKTGNLDTWLKERNADVAVVLAYGRILPKAVLDAPRRGCMNLHASLLPAYRGAAPIQWAIIRGETETGIALMQMDEGLDTGPVYAERRIPIAPEDDAGALTTRLGQLAPVIIEEDLPRAVAGELPLVPQNESQATFAPPLSREDGLLNFNEPARSVVNRVRGLTPRPGAHTTIAGRALKILGARLAPEGGPEAAPGSVVRADKGGLWVSAGRGAVEILTAQLTGKKATTGRDLVNGRVLKLGDVLGT
jgi:methionyl-tRNA formyltransferase